jgi:hypothetical protein
VPQGCALGGQRWESDEDDALTSRRRPASAPFVVRDQDDGRAGVKRLLSSVRTKLATPSLYRPVYDRAVL